MTDAYSDAELEAMMADLESDLVERKESLQGNSPRRIREAVFAYAQFLRIAGNQWSDPVVDEEVCNGSIMELVRRLDPSVRPPLQGDDPGGWPPDSHRGTGIRAAPRPCPIPDTAGPGPCRPGEPRRLRPARS